MLLNLPHRHRHTHSIHGIHNKHLFACFSILKIKINQVKMNALCKFSVCVWECFLVCMCACVVEKEEKKRKKR